MKLKNLVSNVFKSLIVRIRNSTKCTKYNLIQTILLESKQVYSILDNDVQTDAKILPVHGQEGLQFLHNLCSMLT